MLTTSAVAQYSVSAVVCAWYRMGTSGVVLAMGNPAMGDSAFVWSVSMEVATSPTF